MVLNSAVFFQVSANISQSFDSNKANEEHVTKPG